MGSGNKELTKIVNGISPNQLVFRGSPNFPTTLNLKLPVLKGKSSSEVVVNNINAVHTARQASIQNESSNRTRCALQYQIRTFGYVCYFTGNSVYYKWENNSQWHGPGTVIGQDSKQILVKHGSVYVHVHACRITHAIDNDDSNRSNNIWDTAKNATNFFLSRWFQKY